MNYEDACAYVNRRHARGISYNGYIPEWKGATLFFWDKRFYDLILRAIPLEQLRALPEQLKHPVELWIFDMPLEKHPEATAVLYGMLLEGTVDGIIITVVYRRCVDNQRFVNPPIFFPYGSSVVTTQEYLSSCRFPAYSEHFGIRRDITKDGSLEHPFSYLNILVAGAAFIRQKIANESEVKLERHARKRLQKEKIPLLPIRRILLRERESHETVESYDVDWSCRWIVRGHWRATKKGPTWIRAYEKGPEDKPLKPPANIFYEVTR